MKVPWFQHYSSSMEDPDIVDAMKKYGDAAYVIFFGILELMSQEFDPKRPGCLTISVDNIEKKLQRNRDEFVNVLCFFRVRKRFGFRTNTKHGVEFFTIKCNKYKDTMSDYSKKIIRKNSGKIPE